MEIDWWDRLWPDYTDCDEFFRLLVYSIKKNTVYKNIIIIIMPVLC